MKFIPMLVLLSKFSQGSKAQARVSLPRWRLSGPDMFAGQRCMPRCDCLSTVAGFGEQCMVFPLAWS